MSLQVCCIGELMWDFVCCQPADPPASAHYRRDVGGAAANVALTLLSTGVEVSLAGWLATDPLGAALRAALIGRGVDCSTLSEVVGRCGLVFIERRGVELSFASFQPQFTPVPLCLPEYFDRRSTTRRLLHLAGLPVDPVALEALITIQRQALEAGAVVTVDANLRPRQWRNHARLSAERARVIMAAAHVVKLSRDDLALLIPQPQAAAGFDAPWITSLARDSTVVLSHDSQPTDVYAHWGKLSSAEGIAEVAARASGAGDAFCAGLIKAMSTQEADSFDRAFFQRALPLAHRQAATHIAQSQSR